MDDNTRGQLVGQYAEDIFRGKMGFDQLRDPLKVTIEDEHELEVVIEQIEKQVHNLRTAQQERKQGKSIFKGGILLTAFGILLIVGRITNKIDFEGNFLATYGPLLGGLVLMYSGRLKMKAK